jgi:hypothetical protein
MEARRLSLIRFMLIEVMKIMTPGRIAFIGAT